MSGRNGGRGADVKDDVDKDDADEEDADEEADFDDDDETADVDTEGVVSISILHRRAASTFNAFASCSIAFAFSYQQLPSWLYRRQLFSTKDTS